MEVHGIDFQGEYFPKGLVEINQKNVGQSKRNIQTGKQCCRHKEKGRDKKKKKKERGERRLEIYLKN